MNRPAPAADSTHAFRYELERTLALIEVLIDQQFGRFDRPTALHGRCLLASAILADVLHRRGAPAQVVTGTLAVDPGPDIAGLDIGTHAWVRIGKRQLIDPTVCQAERDRFPCPLANLGNALVVDVPPGVDLRRQPVRIRHAAGVAMVYRPFDKRLDAAIRTQPDADPARWKPLAARVVAGLV